MAEPLKNHFNTNVPEILASHIKKHFPDFNDKAFIKDGLNGFEALELKGRGNHLAHTLKSYLPENFEQSVSIIKKSMSEPLTHTDYVPMQSFFYMPHLNFVAFYGLAYPEISLEALHFMTQKFSAEFAIRNFIENHAELTFTYLHQWKNDTNVHVRRLVSEGTRPLLPWAGKLRDLEKNPSPILPILEHLKDDPEIYVRRSVANHLNDIAKAHPELVLEICDTWKDHSNPERMWIINQALRTLIKKGNSKALSIIGMQTDLKLSVYDVNLDKKVVAFGDSVRFSAVITNESKQSGKVVIDYIVQFMKANGSHQPKVFKLTTKELQSGESIAVSKSHTFADLTTRKHYPGLHKLEIQLNGKSFPLGEISLEF
ncbi:DNA alkylation repair protein [bacterium]|nr:MAG: DNA alkylation repair protein [bacterium]